MRMYNASETRQLVARSDSRLWYEDFSTLTNPVKKSKSRDQLGRSGVHRLGNSCVWDDLLKVVNTGNV